MEEIKVTIQEIKEEFSKAGKCDEYTNNPGMTYEQGIRDALEWILTGEKKHLLH